MNTKKPRWMRLRTEGVREQSESCAVDRFGEEGSDERFKLLALT